jgi:hypothetical protein
MLGTLFALVALVYGLIVYFDPEARGTKSDERNRCAPN